MKPASLASRAVPFVIVPCLALAAAAQEPVPLGHGVPDDVHVYVHGVASPHPDPGRVAFENAVGRLLESRVHEDVLDLLTMELPARERQEVRAAVRHAFSLLGSVDWAALAAEEIVFAEKLAIPMPEYLVIFRAPRSGQDHEQSLKRMLEGFADMIGSGQAEVREIERRTGSMTLFSIQGTPVQIAVGRSEDALILSTSPQLTSSAVRRMQSGGEGSLLANEDFRSSLRLLPESTEGIVYFDVDGFLGFMSQVLGLAAAGADDDEAAGAIALCRSVVEMLDVVEHLVVSTASDGTTVIESTLIDLAPDFDVSRLATLVQDQERWREWYRWVPADATGFVFDTGIDVAALFDLVVTLAEENLPYAGWTSSPHFAKLREIAGHVSGETACVFLPPADGQGCPEGDVVCLLRLEKTEGVSEWIERHLQAFARHAESREQPVRLRTRGGLHEVRIDALPWIRPVVGVRDGMLLMATSPAAVERVARVRSGEAPDIRTSERFTRLGIGPDAPSYLDYARVEASVGSIADLLGAVGFFLAMLPEDRDTRAAIETGIILTKLAPALRELDLAYDTASEMVPGPEPDTVLSRRVWRYR